MLVSFRFVFSTDTTKSASRIKAYDIPYGGRYVSHAKKIWTAMQADEYELLCVPLECVDVFLKCADGVYIQVLYGQQR